MQTPDAFVANMIRLRHKRQLTQDQLAQAAGISPHTVRSMEYGRTANPTLDTVFRIATALGVGVETLLAASKAG